MKVQKDIYARLGRLDDSETQISSRTVVSEPAKIVGPKRTPGMENMPRHLQAYCKR